MKPHGAGGNKFRISDILVKSCSLIIKNITSLLILSVALFLALVPESVWTWGLLLLFVAGYTGVLFRFTAVFQLAYVSVSTENLGVWESWQRGYAASSPCWIRISTLFAIVLPIILLPFVGILLWLLPAEAPGGLGALVSSHVVPGDSRPRANDGPTRAYFEARSPGC